MSTTRETRLWLLAFDPSVVGYSATIWETAKNTATGIVYVKTGPADTDWTIAPPGGGSGTGTQGPPGRPGEDGIPGDDGAPGVPGAPGAAGATGPVGADGTPGRPGSDGQDGFDGDPGPPGPTGAAGATGSAGATGPQGPMGPPGNDGEQGPEGERGATGPAGGATITGLGFVHATTAGANGYVTRQGNGFSQVQDFAGGGVGTTLDANQPYETFVVIGPYTIFDGYALTLPDNTAFLAL